MKNKHLFLTLLFAGISFVLFGQNDLPERQRCQNVVVNIDTIICDGRQYMGLSEQGIYYDTVQISSGCDSITVITVDVVGPIIIQIDTVICEGESFLGFSTSGVFTYDSINPETECTEIVILDLSIIPIGSGPCLTGVDEIDDKIMNVYPNPAHSKVFIETLLPIESMRLHSLDGTIVAIKDFNPEGASVSLQLHNEIGDGMYVLVVKMEGKEYFKNLVVSH